MQLESVACPRMAVWCPSMEPRRPGLQLESSPSWSWLITFLYLLLTTDLPGGRRRLGSWWGMASPRDVLGVVGRRHLTRMMSAPGPAGGIRPGAKGRAWGESPRWNVLGWAGRPHPPLVSRSLLRDCRNGSRQERAPDHVVTITPARYAKTICGGSAGDGWPETSAGHGRLWMAPGHAHTR